MQEYLMITDVESNFKELLIKVEPKICSNDAWDSVISISNKDYNPSKGDKLYFLPGVNIPRIKLKDLALQHGIKTVRDIAEATHIFAGKNTKDKLRSNFYSFRIPTDSLRNIYEGSKNIMDEFYRENLRQALENYTLDYVLVDYSSASVLRNSTHAIVQTNLDFESINYTNTYYTVVDEHYNAYKTIQNREIINDSSLLKFINGEDAVVIDEEMFKQLSDMFDSSDTDNHTLAMEIMANCNYMDSVLYLEMLFKEYSYKMSQQRSRNHVNFKSLISFLDKDKSYLGTSIDDIVKSLISKEILDVDKLNVIMKYYSEDIAFSGGTDFFKVKSITLHEETAKLLNTNYVHENIPDFIPEETCDEPVVEEVIVTEDIEPELELITSKEDTILSESELNKDPESLEEVSNNHQIEETNGNDFEWF